MRTRHASIVLLLVVGLLIGITSTAGAQDPDLPLDWKGEGKARVLKNNEFDSVNFTAAIYIGENEKVSGEFSNGEDKVELKKLYYSTPSNGARKLILVLVKETGDNPMLLVLEGRVLKGIMYYGEILAKRYEADGEVETNLDLDNQYIQEIYTGYAPSSLENAKNACIPMGAFIIESDSN